MRFLYFGLFAIVLGCLGCSDSETAPTVSPPSSFVQEFVAQESFPHLQSSKQIFYHREIEFFFCEYGEGMDCPSGCIYSKAIGLAYEGRVGWLTVEDLLGDYPEQGRYFNFEASDTRLFDFDFWILLLELDCRACYNSLLESLAAGEETSRSAFLTMSSIMYTSTWPELADILVENLAISEDEEILSLLANLPVLESDFYLMARLRAQELLDDLN